MPGTAGTLTLEFEPFPADLAAPAGGEGRPAGHKLVLYPESADWKPAGSSATGRLSVTVVDYWA